MEPWIWALIIVALVVVVVAVLVKATAARRRTSSLRDRFGPEYDRTVRTSSSRRAAEEQLSDRAATRSRLRIVPLAEPSRLRYAEEWHRVQAQFVDRPTAAVEAAGYLLTRVMEERGYPVSDVDRQADLVSVDHPTLVEDYRNAHAISRRARDGGASTEDLREALLRYRSLFENLLRPEGSAEPIDGAETRPGEHRVDERGIGEHRSDEHRVDLAAADQDAATGQPLHRQPVREERR